jgi:hypothetical protein
MKVKYEKQENQGRAESPHDPETQDHRHQTDPVNKDLTILLKETFKKKTII